MMVLDKDVLDGEIVALMDTKMTDETLQTAFLTMHHVIIITKMMELELYVFIRHLIVLQDIEMMED